MHLVAELENLDTFPGVEISQGGPLTGGNFLYSKTELVQRFRDDEALLMIIAKMFGETEYGLSEHGYLAIAIHRAAQIYSIPSIIQSLSEHHREMLVKVLQVDAYSYVGWSAAETIRAFQDYEGNEEKIRKIVDYADQREHYTKTLRQLSQIKVDMVRIIGAAEFSEVVGR